MNKYERYKKVNLPWLKEIPNHWCIDKTKRFSENKKEINKGNRERNILSLTLKGVVKNNIENPNGLTPESYETYQIFEKNDLVFKLIDLENIKTSRVGIVEENGIMSSAYIRLVFGSSIYPKYVYYYFFKLYIEQVYNNLGSGVRSTMNSDDLRDILLPIPPIKEQVQIANYLDWKINEIDRLIQIEKEKIKQLNQTMQISINSRYKILNLEDETNKGVKIKYLANQITQHKGEYRRYIALENIISQKGMMKISFDNLEFNSDGISVEKNMVIFGKLRPYLAKTIVVENKAVCSSEFLVLNPIKLMPLYLKYLMLSSKFIDLVDSSTYGTKMPRVNSDFILNLKIVVPDLSEQKKVVEKILESENRINKVIEVIIKKIESMENLKQSLISEVVTGQIDVRDIAIPEYEKVAITDGEIEETDEMEGKEYGN